MPIRVKVTDLDAEALRESISRDLLDTVWTAIDAGMSLSQLQSIWSEIMERNALVALIEDALESHDWFDANGEDMHAAAETVYKVIADKISVK